MGFDPVSMAVMAGISAVSSFADSRAQAGQAKFQAAVAQQNARIGLMNAAYAAKAGQQKEQAEAYKFRGLIGQQIAAQGANGLDVNSGSAVSVRDSAAALAMTSAANIRDNANREEYGYRAQSTQASNQAALYKASAPTMFQSLLGAAVSGAKTYAGLGGGSPFGGGGSTAAGIGRAGIAGSYSSAPTGGFSAAPISLVF